MRETELSLLNFEAQSKLCTKDKSGVLLKTKWGTILDAVSSYYPIWKTKNVSPRLSQSEAMVSEKPKDIRIPFSCFYFHVYDSRG